MNRPLALIALVSDLELEQVCSSRRASIVACRETNRVLLVAAESKRTVTEESSIADAGVAESSRAFASDQYSRYGQGPAEVHKSGAAKLDVASKLQQRGCRVSLKQSATAARNDDDRGRFRISGSVRLANSVSLDVELFNPRIQGRKGNSGLAGTSVRPGHFSVTFRQRHFNEFLFRGHVLSILFVRAAPPALGARQDRN